MLDIVDNDTRFDRSLRSVLARPRIAVISSFPPRECGIATYTRDLISRMEWPQAAIDSHAEIQVKPVVFAMEDEPGKYRYDEQVVGTIARDDVASYLAAARTINESDIGVVSIQHEYGLFGGEYGEYLLHFMRAVQRPVVITLHTVLDHPEPGMRRVTEALGELAAGIVVLAERARSIIKAYYPRIDLAKVHFIPHGAPSVPFAPTDEAKAKLGFEGRTVLSTFGLLSPDKGIEYAIEALPALVERHPEVLYLVLGETHPGHVKHNGETYRDSLEAMVDRLNLRDHVRFENRYLDLEDLIGYLQATDIYVIPYLNPRQIVSGTLTYAVASGKPVVSTSFIYAQELLSHGRGLLTQFRDSGDLSRNIAALLDHPEKREEISQRAYQYGRRLQWPAVARSYCRLYSRVENAAASQVAWKSPHSVLGKHDLGVPKATAERTGMPVHTSAKQAIGIMTRSAQSLVTGIDRLNDGIDVVTTA